MEVQRAKINQTTLVEGNIMKNFALLNIKIPNETVVIIY